MFLFKFLFMHTGSQQALPIVHNSLVSIYGTEMLHVNDI